MLESSKIKSKSLLVVPSKIKLKSLLAVSLVVALIGIGMVLFDALGKQRLLTILQAHAMIIIGLLLTLIGGFGIIFTSRRLSRTRRDENAPLTVGEQELVNDVSRRLRIWFLQYKVWNRIYWLFGVLGVATGALAASDVTGPGSQLRSYFAITSSICLAIIGFLNPQRQSTRFISAWRLLDISLTDFRLKLNRLKGDDKNNLEERKNEARQLIEDLRRAESILGQTDISQSRPSVAAN